MSKKFETTVARANEIFATRDASSLNVQKMIKNYSLHAKLLFALTFDVETLNDDVHKFNTKVVDFAKFLNGETLDLNNHIRAFFLTAFRLHQAEKKFTSDDMKKACDAQFKAKNDHDKLIVTVPKVYTAGTTGAQSSQARAMLRDFKIFKQISKEVDELDTENKHTKKLIEILHLA